MKKICLFLILILLPVIASAVSPDYSVKGYYANMQINDDGSLTVKEAIVLKGSMNGYERSLTLNNSNVSQNEQINFNGDSRYNPKEISNIKVAAYEVSEANINILDKQKSYSELVPFASTGSKNLFTRSDNNETITIRSYYSCADCQVAYYMEYTLKDLTIIHNDTAEIYYQLFSTNYVTEDMGEIKINVQYPQDDKNAKMWVHGNVYGEVTKTKDDTFTITSKSFPKYSMLDFRTLFNKDLITNQTTLIKSNVDATAQVLEIEKQRAAEREAEIKKIKRIILIYNVTSIIYFIFFVAFLIYIYFKYDRELKTDFNSKYYREFIEDYNVEVIDYLMKKNITPNAMSASIMNLIYKKKISAEQKPEDKKSYLFKLVSKEGLTESEQILVDFLFTKVGNNDTFTTEELKKYAESTKTYDKFTKNYTDWKKSVIAEGQKQDFFFTNTGIKVIANVYIIFGIILSFFCLINIDGFIFGKILWLFLIPALIYVNAFTKKTAKGILHYKKWQAFKNFLQDFGTFELKELPEIVLWERYLVYATVFGLADQVEKTMNVKIKEFNPEESIGTDVYVYHSYYDFANINHTISQSVENAHSLALSTAASQHVSNYSGGGGGFSSGGGFGGGGGGGHGF